MKSSLCLFLITMTLLLAACQRQVPPALTDVSISQDGASPTPSVTLSPLASSTPKVHATPTHSPSPTVPFTQTPRPTTVFPLVERLLFELPASISPGIKIQIFKINNLITPNTVNYAETWSLIDAQSIIPNREPLSATAYWEKNLAQTNQVLAPFGYSLRESGNLSDPYRLFAGAEPLLVGSLESGPSVNRSQSDFVMFMVSHASQQTVMIHRDAIEPLTNYQAIVYSHGTYPLYIGDDLIYAIQESNPNGNGSVIHVYLSEQIIYTAPLPTFITVLPNIYRFTVYEDSRGAHWALEVPGALHIDGIPVNQTYGYQSSYEFHTLGGKAAYLFEKDGVLGLNIDGQEVLLPGESTPHYQCCMHDRPNPAFSGNNLAFDLKDGETWYYVEVLVE